MKRFVYIPLVIIALLIAACGPAVEPEAEGDLLNEDVFLLALPRIVIEVDQEGVPSLLGLTPNDIGQILGRDLSGMRLDPALVTQLVDGGVQHVEIRQTGNGLALLANGKLLPHIGYTDASLQQLGVLGPALDIPLPSLAVRALPVLRRLGLNIVVRFPRQEGVAEIAVADPQEPIQVQTPPADQEPSAILRAEVRYDEDGVPGILGITANDLAQLGIMVPASLSQQMIQRLQTQNIQNLEINSEPIGLFIYANGELLPFLVWDETMLNNVAELYTQMQPDDRYNEVAQLGVPFLNDMDMNVLLHFPLAEGVEPLAVSMH